MDLRAIEKQQQFIRDSAFIKHESFLSEKEWRIVLTEQDLEKGNDWIELYNWDEEDNIGIMKFFPNGLQFRSVGDDIISYLDLSFEEYIDEAIDCIILGPNCKAQMRDISQMIQHFRFWNFNEDHIYLSKSPYRLK